jgi:hypothetical protein
MTEKTIYSATENIHDNVKAVVRKSNTDERLKKYTEDILMFHKMENYIKDIYENNFTKKLINKLAYNANILKIKIVIVKEYAVKIIFTVELFENDENITRLNNFFICITIELKNDNSFYTDIKIVNSDKEKETSYF